MKKLSLRVISILLMVSFYFSDCILAETANAKVIYEKQKKNQAQEKLKKIIDNSKVNFFEPETSFTNEKGEEINLKNFRGKAVLIYFWATYCNDCINGLHSIMKLRDKVSFTANSNIVALPISVDFRKAVKVKESMSKKEIDLPLFFDAKRKLLADFQIDNLPLTVIIDSEGNVVNVIKQLVDFSDDIFFNYLKSHAGEKSVVYDAETSIIENSKAIDIKEENATSENQENQH